METETFLTDLLGRTFAVGDRLAYGGRAGSHGYMAVGEVVKINASTVSVKVIAHSGWAEIGSVQTVQRPKRAVILR